MPKKAKSEKSKKEPVKSKNSSNDVDKAFAKKADSTSASKILAQITIPQIPCDAIQPWSDAFHTCFIMFYLFDALCGQHIYLYKVSYQIGGPHFYW